MEDILLCHGVLDTEKFTDRVEAAAAAGASAIALDMSRYRRHLSAGESDADMVAAARANGVRVEEIYSLYGSVQKENSDRTAAFADQLFRLADLFGSRTIGSSSNLDCPTEEAGELIGQLADRAAEHGLRVGLEFVAFTSLRDVKTTCDIISASGRPNICVILDCWHFFRGVPDLEMLANVPGELISIVQLNDGYGHPRCEDPQEEVRRFREIPGEGEFDVDSLVRVLDRLNPEIRWCAEVGTDELASSTPKAAASRIVSGCRDFLQVARGNGPRNRIEVV